MPYSQLFYHLVWATKGREPRLTEEIEPIVFRFLQSKRVCGKGGGTNQAKSRAMEAWMLSAAWRGSGAFWIGRPTTM